MFVFEGKMKQVLSHFEPAVAVQNKKCRKEDINFS